MRSCDRICELFHQTCFGVVDILWLNVMAVFSVDALLDRLCMVFQSMCVVCL